MKRYAYAWITLAFFLVSIVGHWIFGWYAFVDDQKALHQPVELTPYLMEMGRDTFENWQSEFLQLLWQVVGLAYFLYLGSPTSHENDDRLEAKVDEVLPDELRLLLVDRAGRSVIHGDLAGPEAPLRERSRADEVRAGWVRLLGPGVEHSRTEKAAPWAGGKRARQSGIGSPVDGVVDRST